MSLNDYKNWMDSQEGKDDRRRFVFNLQSMLDNYRFKSHVCWHIEGYDSTIIIEAQDGDFRFEHEFSGDSVADVIIAYGVNEAVDMYQRIFLNRYTQTRQQVTM